MMTLLSQLKQADVFKSISENVGGTSSGSSDYSFDPRLGYALVIAAAAVMILVALVNMKRKRAASPRAVNHQGRLFKEILKRIPLKKAELKALKMVANEQGCESPLTLILCPSVLARGIGAKGKSDKKVLLNVAKKMGLMKKKPA